MNLSYMLNHLGEDREMYYNAVSPPIIQTSNFAFKTVAQMSAAFTDEKTNRIYTRGNNPTSEILCKKIAALENTDDCLVVSSGAAAISIAVISQLKAGDHVVSVQHPYSWANHLFTVILKRFNIEVTFVEGSDSSNFKNAIRPNTTVFYLESPSTFYFELQDLQQISTIAKSNNIITIIDNSYCSPLCQQPANFGIDLIIHSATKYINGHSDVVAGIICGNFDLIKKIYHSEFLNFGAISAPINSWLMLRSLRTLPLRIKQSSATAQQLVTWLSNHPKIEKIYYPFHPSHPQYELAKKQMKMPMGLFSVLLKATEKSAVIKFCESLNYFLMAVSWGGYESLILPCCAFPEGSIYPFNMVRFYIGLEEPEVLQSDIEQALALI